MPHEGTFSQTVQARKPPLPIDSGFSSKFNFLIDSNQRDPRIFLAMQLASKTPLLPTMTSQQAIEDSALLRALRMNALQVCI